MIDGMLLPLHPLLFTSVYLGKEGQAGPFEDLFHDTGFSLHYGDLFSVQCRMV